MALPESSLSMICSSISTFLGAGIDASSHNIAMSLGAPADVPRDDGQHHINLFFYRFEPGGFDADVRPDEIWRLRMFCLITTFGVDEDNVAAGENELRMLGAVIRIFHEQPVLGAVAVNGEQVRLQVVFNPVSDEQINQVWSTQGDAAYRPSVIYEMALAAVVPSQVHIPPPLAGALGNQSYADIAQRHAGFSGRVQAPAVEFQRVDVSDPQWAPEICWIHQNDCAHSLSFDVSSPEFAGFTPAVWIAGDPGSDVDLVWEIWDRVDGWRRTGAAVTVPAFSSAIDPDHIPASSASFPQTIALAVSIPAGQHAAQGLLYATRQVNLPGQAPIEIRSNPLLISLWSS